MLPPLLRVGALAASVFVTSVSAQQLVLEETERLPYPDVAEASDDARTAISRFALPPGFKATLWAAEPMLANPVAIDFDEKGRLFVAETYRYRTSVLDIRHYMAMLERDLALRTVEDRRQMIHDVFGEQAPLLAIESEVLRLIEDRDGDGVAEHSEIFADDFNTELDGIASGVLARQGKVWFTNIPSLWLLERPGDTRPGADPAPVQRTELLTGFGVRFGYTGHDFHGLAFGPDGKLYYSIGDRGVHVQTKEGGVVAMPDWGAVFRSNPDGTELEVVATGLRNPQELVFDEHGNLFTGENDADAGDLERLVYVVEGGDYGWRVGYQHPALGDDSPWMSERLWAPRHPAQPAYVLPAICNIEDGPSGLTYYPGTGLSTDYTGHFFITHFKGSIARSGVQTYQVRPDGAHFAPTASSQFIGGLLPTDVTFGPDGRFYLSDWVEGWPKSRKGRIYAISRIHEDAAAQARRVEVQELLRTGMAGYELPQLVALLAHPDQRIRLEAQFELAARGPGSVGALQTLAAQATAAPLARLHAIWALGQLARTAPAAVTVLPALLRDADPEVRAQAAKVLGDQKVAAGYDGLVERLQDEAARVRFFAAQSLGKLGRADAAPALIELLRRNQDRDAYERHAAVHALEHLGRTPALAAAEKDASRSVRLGALLVYRRLGDAAAASFLHDQDPYLVREAARAINDAPINAALPALAARLADAPVDDEVLMLRVLNAHFRLGAPENARALAAFAARSDVPAALRVEALTHLRQWPQPPQRDRVMGLYRPLSGRDAATAAAALEPQVKGLLQDGSGRTQRATLATIEALGMRTALPEVRRLVQNEQATGGARAAALRVLEALEDPELLPLVTAAGRSPAPAVRLAALRILARIAPQEALPVIERLANTGTPAEQRGAFNALARLETPAGQPVLVRSLQRLAAGEVAPSAQFELLEAAEKSRAPEVQQLLERQKADWAAGDDPLAPFRGALDGGDQQRGARVFYNNPIMACVRCHKVNGSGGDAGPDLTAVGAARPPEHILESIIKPSAQITPGFNMVTLTLTDGTVESGIVLHEDAESLVLRRPDGTEVTLQPAQVRTREAAPSSMPEIYAHILSRGELRDLMAFLTQLDEEEPEPDDGPRALRTGLPADEGRGDEPTLEYEEVEDELGSP